MILRHWGIEPYTVPTGSMAPAITGHHRTRICPRCGFPVLVGRRPGDRGDGPPSTRLYRKAYCLNCGKTELDMHDAPESAGDQLLVNRHVFAFRKPRRWEMVVFRLFGITFIKRIIGLPGEDLAILDGDVYVNGELQRKSLADVRALRIAVFDNDFQPEPGGWRQRWEVAADHSGPHPLKGTELHLDGEASPEGYQLVTYRHYQLDSRQCEPVVDEYGYNGGERTPPTAVHDFVMECKLEVGSGAGAVLLGITDGQTHLLAEIAAGTVKDRRIAGARLRRTTSWPPDLPDAWPGDGATLLQMAHNVHLKGGRSYRVELAFVDRRITLALNGKVVLGPVDLPPACNRSEVVRPVLLGARGVHLTVRNFRLFRDIHYRSTGPNGSHGKAVHLGFDQYFVLGDNSPNSKDSRFWPDGGAVPAHNLLGKPFLVHVPGRITGGGPETRAIQGTDWGRVRWIR